MERRMKKLLVVFVALAMIVGLCACVPQTSGTNTPAGQTTGNNTPSKALIRVGFAQCKADESDWRKANTKSVQEALSKENGFDLILADSNNDAAKQVSDVQGSSIRK